MKYFKVKTGYGAMDYVSVDETELQTAIRAQINGGVGVFKQGTVTGNHIISISPDWNKVMGYNKDYQMTGADIREIPRKTKDEHELFLENAGEMVKAKLENRQPQLKSLENPVKLYTKEPTAIGDLIKRAS